MAVAGVDGRGRRCENPLQITGKKRFLTAHEIGQAQQAVSSEVDDARGIGARPLGRSAADHHRTAFTEPPRRPHQHRVGHEQVGNPHVASRGWPGRLLQSNAIPGQRRERPAAGDDELIRGHQASPASLERLCAEEHRGGGPQPGEGPQAVPFRVVKEHPTHDPDPPSLWLPT